MADPIQSPKVLHTQNIRGTKQRTISLGADDV